MRIPFSNNADEILPRLWLGNSNAAADELFLKNAGIKTVFNCTKDLPFAPLITRRYRLPIDDNLQEEEIRNMEIWSYETVVKMIDEYKAGHGILVHCYAGMQRSPAAIAMFLIAAFDMSFDQTATLMKQKRPVVFFPSANFEKSVRGFERSLRKQQRL